MLVRSDFGFRESGLAKLAKPPRKGPIGGSDGPRKEESSLAFAASALVSDCLSEHQVQRIPLWPGIYISLEPNVGSFLPSFSL
jgi:hypothetical protein